MSRSSFDSPYRYQISSIVSAFCLRSFLSEQYMVKFWYVRLLCDVFVVMFDISVFGFLPKYASNGIILVVVFEINLMFSTMFAKRCATVAFDQLGSMSSNAILHFIVSMSRSTIPVPLWSRAVARISFYFSVFGEYSEFFWFKSLCLITTNGAWYSW